LDARKGQRWAGGQPEREGKQEAAEHTSMESHRRLN
jgi:hypothetical protein